MRALLLALAGLCALLFAAPAHALLVLSYHDIRDDVAPKGEIVIVVGPPGEPEPPDASDTDAALREALTNLSPSRAEAKVAADFALPRKPLYERALALSEE